MNTPSTTHPDRDPADDRLSREDGFTLVEMLVVLAIIALITTLVAPQILRYLGARRRRAGADTQPLQRTRALLHRQWRLSDEGGGAVGTDDRARLGDALERSLHEGRRQARRSLG